MRKRVALMLLSAAVVLASNQSSIIKPVEVNATEEKLSNPKVANNVSTWDCIWFGNYYQANNKNKEPIKWRVLSVNGDEAFLLADSGLDCQKYNRTYSPVTWETCTLRSWLNNEFINNAFADDEKVAIKNTSVINDDNPEYGTSAGNNTTDRVFILSLSEYLNSAYGFSSDATEYDQARRIKVTQYAKSKGAGVSDREGYVGNGYGWLRTPGRNADDAACIFDSGYIVRSGNTVHGSNLVVRPAMHISLSASESWSYAGTVGSDGDIKEIAANTKKTSSKSSVKNQITKNNKEKNKTKKKKIFVKKIKLKARKKKVKVGKKLKIKVLYTPKKVTSKKVKWSVSNKKWASISKKGIFKAKKAGKGKSVVVRCKTLDGSKKIARIRIKILN